MGANPCQLVCTMKRRRLGTRLIRLIEHLFPEGVEYDSFIKKNLEQAP